MIFEFLVNSCIPAHDVVLYISFSLLPPSWDGYAIFPKIAGDYTSRLAVPMVFVARKAVKLRETTVLRWRWASRSLCLQLQAFFSYTVFQRHRRIRSETFQNEYRAQTPTLLGKKNSSLHDVNFADSNKDRFTGD